MAVSREIRAFVLELFDELGQITARAMMGGLALYADGRIFAIITSEGRVFLKAAGPLAERLADAGCEPFTYERAPGKTTRMGYWSLPDSALDDPEEACGWARQALAGSGFP